MTLWLIPTLLSNRRLSNPYSSLSERHRHTCRCMRLLSVFFSKERSSFWERSIPFQIFPRSSPKSFYIFESFIGFPTARADVVERKPERGCLLPPPTTTAPGRVGLNRPRVIHAPMLGRTMVDFCA